MTEELSLSETKSKPLLQRVERPHELLRFIDWLAQPKALRVPATQGELAIQLDVSEPTLSNWKYLPGFWDEVKERTIFWGRERTPNVIAALYRKAIKEGNAFEAKLWLQYIEGWKEKTEVDQRNLHKHVIITRGEHGTGNTDRSVPGTVAELAQSSAESVEQTPVQDN